MLVVCVFGGPEKLPGWLRRGLFAFVPRLKLHRTRQLSPILCRAELPGAAAQQWAMQWAPHSQVPMAMPQMAGYPQMAVTETADGLGGPIRASYLSMSFADGDVLRNHLV